MEKKWPEGVTILGDLFLLCIIPGLMGAFIGLMSGPSQSEDAVGNLLDDFIRTMLILCPLIFLIEGIGILKLKNWARIFTIIFCLTNTLLVATYYIHSHIIAKMPLDIFNDLMWLLIGVFSMFVIYYLTRTKVKELFT